MKRKLVAGLIGAGNISPYHINGYSKAGVELKAIVDIIPERAKEKAEKHEIEKVFTDYKEMLKKCPEIDLISVCTPNYLHAEMTINCLKAGKNVLCEKPPAVNATEALRMMDAAKKAGKVLMFDFNNRARPEAQALMKHIENGEIGEINSAQAAWTRRQGIPGFGGWFTQRSMAGGGPVIDLLHMLDLALYFMRYPEPEWVLARMFRDFSDNPDFKGPWGFPDVEGGKVDVEMASHALVTFKTGAVLFVRNSWAEMNKYVEDFYVRLQGKKAGIDLGTYLETYGGDITKAEEHAVSRCEIYTVEKGHPVDKVIKVDPDPKMGRERSVINFVNVVAGKEKAFNNPHEAVILMRIIDALYESARMGKPTMVRSLTNTG